MPKTRIPSVIAASAALSAGATRFAMPRCRAQTAIDNYCHLAFPAISTALFGLGAGGVFSLDKITPNQKKSRSESWIIRGVRAELYAPKFGSVWLPVRSKRAVEKYPENWV
jgi:hypothetical protein